MDKKRKEGKSSEIVNLKKEIERLKAQIEDYKSRYLRALADYQNLEKKVNEEKKEFLKLANKNLLLKIINIFDDIERAEVFIKDKGLALIKERLLKVLKEEGVREIEVLGKPFNPYLAEAVEINEGSDDNLVVEVLRKGYYYYDKVLRPAQVKVGQKKDVKLEVKS